MFKKVVFVTVVIILGMIIVPTIYKVYLNTNDNLIKVVEKEFGYYAKKCYNEDRCESTVYLKDLYDNKYLEEKLTDPISKQYYSDKSYFNLLNGEVSLIL
ncbi:MAG: hypothetical protein NC483_02035 [Ruminococcus sp.]|nr:hypothetical protein [Ruminococcus sp.]